MSLFPNPALADVDQSVSGEADRWMVLERATSSGLPLVVSARVGNALVAEMLNQANLTTISCVADPQRLAEKRMPMGTDALYPLEDMLGQSQVLQSAKALHVASVTGDGMRRVVFVHRKPIDFKPIISGFHADGFNCSAAPETDRHQIVALVSPTDVEVQLNGDREIIDILQTKGDDGRSARKTDFWFYGSKASLEIVAAELKLLGFTIKQPTDDGKGIILSREMPVDPATFAELTPKLVSTAHRANAEYDGWETLVVTPEKMPGSKN